MLRVATLLSLALALACSTPPPPPETDSTAKPNLVIIVADDLGYRDVGFHGGPIATPNIDRIAAEGAALERFYVAPVCSPTRAGLMTGRWPIRFGAMRTVFPPWREGGLDTSEVTLADVLAEAGYERRGVFGKWHLGHSDVKYHPLQRGFTHFYGHYNGALDYFTHEREGELDWHENYATSYDEGYTTDLIADRAAAFIRDSAAAGGPFLCYVPFNAPHSPFQAKQEDLEPYAELAPVPGDWPDRSDEQRLRNRRILGGMIAGLDRGVGRVLGALDQAGAADETLVWFFSDNGGVGGIGDNTPLRGAKATAFEGGVRVAAAVRWPGRVEAGGIVEAPLAYIDVLPTLMAITGVDDHGGKPLDGINALPILTGEAGAVDREIYAYIGAQGPETEGISVRTAEWKLVVNGPDLSDSEADDSRRERLLFRIAEDPNETTDVAAEHPDVVAELYAKVKAFRELQPADGVPPYAEGREGFIAPEEWRLGPPASE